MSNNAAPLHENDPTTRLLAALMALSAALPRSEDDPERGDVPGWVLVTVMTAGLVTALWLVAEPQLRDMFTTALGAVSGPAGP